MSPKVIAGYLLAALLLVGSLDARQATPTASPPDGRILGVVIDESNHPVVGALVP
jgi:hypothetical protein